MGPKINPWAEVEKAEIRYEYIVRRTAGLFKYIEGKRLDIDQSALANPDAVVKEVTAFLDNKYQTNETQRKVARMVKHVKNSISIKTNKDA